MASYYTYIGEYINTLLSKIHKIDLYKKVTNTLYGEIVDGYYGEDVPLNYSPLLGSTRKYPKPIEGKEYLKNKADLFWIDDELWKVLRN